MNECRLVKKKQKTFNLFTVFSSKINVLILDILFIYSFQPQFLSELTLFLMVIWQTWATTAGIKVYFRIRAYTNRYCSRIEIRARALNISNSPNNLCSREL